MRQPTRNAAPRKSSGRRKLLLLLTVVVVALGAIFFLRGPGVSHSATSTPTVKHHAKHTVQLPPISHYAARSLSILDNSTQLFNQSVAQVAGRGGLGAIGSACNTAQQQLSVLSAEFNGVPHRGPWYYRVGMFHHRVMGAYHNMLGSMTACGIAAANGDPGAAAQAISDMTAAAQWMRRLDRRAHWLAHHK